MTENLNRWSAEAAAGEIRDMIRVWYMCSWYIPKGGGRVGLPGTELGKKREQLWPGKKKKLKMLRFLQQHRHF